MAGIENQNAPVLQYLKEPVNTINDLYARYPAGGEYGWFALVHSEKAFAFWDYVNLKWTILGNPITNDAYDYGPYNSVEDACIAIPAALRRRGKTVGIYNVDGIIEYWWENSITDDDLIQKTYFRKVEDSSGLPAIYRVELNYIMEDPLSNRFFKLNASNNNSYYIYKGYSQSQCIALDSYYDANRNNIFIDESDLFELEINDQSGYLAFASIHNDTDLSDDFTIAISSSENQNDSLIFTSKNKGVIDENIVDETALYTIYISQSGTNNLYPAIITPLDGLHLGVNYTQWIERLNADLLDGHHWSEINNLAISPAVQIGLNLKKNTSQYSSRILRTDIVWDGNWIKIATTASVNTSKIDITRFCLSIGSGTIELDAIVRYPSRLTYNGSIYQGFYLKDAENILTKIGTFDYIELDYDVISDSFTRYDGRKQILGRGVVSNHYGTGDTAFHIMAMRAVFFMIFPEFDDYKYYDTACDIISNNTMLDNSFEGEYMALRDADMIVKPYTSYAPNADIGSNPNVLEIGSHTSTSNTFQQRNITADEKTFMNNCIAVVSRKNDVLPNIIEEFVGDISTSYGYGVEFFEEALASDIRSEYNNPKSPAWIAYVRTDATGLICTVDAGDNTTDAMNYLIIGDTVFKNDELPVNLPYAIYNPTSPKTTISNISLVGSNAVITVANAFTPNTYFLMWALAPAEYPYPILKYMQSQASFVVAAKFKKIQFATNANWQVIREAARATAYLANKTMILAVAVNTGTISSITLVGDITGKLASATSPGNMTGYVVGRIKIGDQYFSYKNFTFNGTNSVLTGDAQTLTFSAIQAIGTTVTLIWDAYRGFGKVMVDDAIQYIKDNYSENDDYLADLADKVEWENEKYSMLRYEDLKDNTPVPKKFIQSLIDRITALENT